MYNHTSTHTLILFFTKQNGPGFLQTKLKVLGAEGILIQSVVPESPLLQRATSHLYFQWWLPAFLANQIIESIAVQVRILLHIKVHPPAC